MATDGEQVYATVSDVGRTLGRHPLDPRRYVVDPQRGGGLTALRVADGSRVWYVRPLPARRRAGRLQPGEPGAVTVDSGRRVRGVQRWPLRAYARPTASALGLRHDARFETVNGVKARGGSIDGPGAVVAGGIVFVDSGYSRNGGVPGNVLLAFRAE